jgi:hypothetical protein
VGQFGILEVGWVGLRVCVLNCLTQVMACECPQPGIGAKGKWMGRFHAPAHVLLYAIGCGNAPA